MSSENIIALETEVDVPEVKVRKQRGPGKKEVKLTEDPAYFSNYWREKRAVKTVCENCGKFIVKGKIYRHRKSNICAKNTKTPEEIQKIMNDLEQTLVDEV